MTSRLLAAGAGLLLLAGAAHSAEIKVLSTQATQDAYKELVPQFEQATGNKVTTVFTGTLGANERLADGESYDMLIMSSGSIDEYLKSGKLAVGSRVDVAKSGVGIGIKAGARKPDISSVEALKQTMLSARSISYSTGPSGIYIDRQDRIYVADSESGSVDKARTDWKRGIRIGSAKDGKVTAFIPDPATNPPSTSAAEGVAVDAAGNIYGAEVGPRALKRYVKK